MSEFIMDLAIGILAIGAICLLGPIIDDVVNIAGGLLGSCSSDDNHDGPSLL